MKGTLIAYRLKPPQDPNTASMLVKKLYGQDTTSHKGKYRYRRQGLLDTIPSRRLIRGVIIVRMEDEDKVVKLLEEFGAEIYVREVILTKRDIKLLDFE